MMKEKGTGVSPSSEHRDNGPGFRVAGYVG